MSCLILFELCAQTGWVLSQRISRAALAASLATFTKSEAKSASRVVCVSLALALALALALQKPLAACRRRIRGLLPPVLEIKSLLFQAPLGPVRHVQEHLGGSTQLLQGHGAPLGAAGESHVPVHAQPPPGAHALQSHPAGVPLGIRARHELREAPALPLQVHLAAPPHPQASLEPPAVVADAPQAQRALWRPLHQEAGRLLGAREGHHRRYLQRGQPAAILH
mmetsp:Transcript_74250/g.193699  ORF Transcript_74250/g.193699 Transcript_74250/m.193699 type:complete len:223 (+) Transcript_74250:97-765(+)